MRVSIASPLTQPSPNGRRVGIRIVTFEACSGFTHVTARRIAQPPKATFVTRLQPCRLPSRAARQLPDQSTTLWVESSSTDDSRLRGALPIMDIAAAPADPAIKARFDALGGTVFALSPDQFGKLLATRRRGGQGGMGGRTSGWNRHRGTLDLITAGAIAGFPWVS